MPFSHITTWIFDMDDTLYPANTGFKEMVYSLFHSHIAERHGMTVEEARALTEEIRKRYGDTRIGFMKEKGFDLDEWERIVTSQDYGVVPVCAVTEAHLGRLPGRKIIFTDAGRPHAEKMLRHLNIHHHFEHIDDFTTRGLRDKPTSEIYDELIDRLQVDPTHCAFFEDTVKNLKPAHELGMTTFLIGTHAPKHDYVDHQYARLLDFFDDFHRQTKRRAG